MKKIKTIVAGDVVKLSDENFEKLKVIVKDKKISKNLFEVRYKQRDEDNKQMYCGLTEKDVKLEDLFTMRIREAILEIVEPADVTIDFSDEFEDVLKFNSTGRKILDKIKGYEGSIRQLEKNYFSSRIINGEVMFTYIPSAKEVDMEYDYYNDDKRKKYEKAVKPIKLVQELLKYMYPSFELTQDIVDDLIACINKDVPGEFVVVSGSDISKYYSEKTYIEQRGTLGKSCMKKDYMSKCGVFNIYEDSCRMLILKDKTSDKIYGRALIWDLHQDHENREAVNMNGKVLLDRIYTVDDALVGAFKNYAWKQGWYTLARQTYEVTDWELDGSTVNVYRSYIYVKVNPRINHYMYYPYMDTFGRLYGEHLDKFFIRGGVKNDDWTYFGMHNSTSGGRDINSRARALGLRYAQVNSNGE